MKWSLVAVSRSFHAKYVTQLTKICFNDKKLNEKFSSGQKFTKFGGPQRQNSGCFHWDTDRFRPFTSRRECFSLSVPTNSWKRGKEHRIVFQEEREKLNSDFFSSFVTSSDNLFNIDYIMENFKPFYVSLPNFSVIGLLDQKLLAFKMVTQQKNTLYFRVINRGELP